MDSSSTKSNITKRVLETRKQTEELKAQLQNLIESGNNVVPTYSKVSNHLNYDTENKFSNLKSGDPTLTADINKPSTSKYISNTQQADKHSQSQQFLKTISTKKIRNIGPQEKKQCEKYMEREKAKGELQKQKLLELHKKSLEIVTKNVQAKRERSKSQERTDGYIHPNQIRATRNNRSLSRERNVLGSKCEKSLDRSNTLRCEAEKQKNPHLLYPPLPNYLVKHQETKNDASQPEKLTQIPDKGPEISKKNKAEPNISQRVTPDIRIKHKLLKPTNLFHLPHSKTEVFNRRTQNSEVQNLPVKNILDYKSSKINKSSCNITLRSSIEQLEPFEATLTQPNSLIEYQSTNDHNPMSNLSVATVGTVKLEPDQKSRPNDVQQEKLAYMSPGDFINTVKQKLQRVVNSPRPLRDIRGQSLIVEDISQPNTPEKTKPREEIFEALQFSPKSSRKYDKQLLPLPMANDFDLPKNVPEKNASGLAIISNIQLAPPYTQRITYAAKPDGTNPEVTSYKPKSESIRNTGAIPKQTGRKVILTVESEEENLSSQCDLSRSRESIIAFNSPTYNKVIIRSPSNLERQCTTETCISPCSKDHHSFVPENKSSAQSDFIPDGFLMADQQETPQKSKCEVETANEHKKTTDDTIFNREDNNLKSLRNVPAETDSQNSKGAIKKHRKGMSKTKSENYMSLCTDHQPTASDVNRMVKYDSILQRDEQNINTHRGSDIICETEKVTDGLPLNVPPNVTNQEADGKQEDKRKKWPAKKVSLRSDWSQIPENMHDTNEIHLKFEAEIHLLNNFNESLSAVEKAVESIQSQNVNNDMVIKQFQSQETQTSMVSNRGLVSSINYSRGSGIGDDSSLTNLELIESKLEDSSVSTGLETSNLNKSTSSAVRSHSDLFNIENSQFNNFAGMSLRMFEQLIKDEDVRLENLKIILKIREQALLDRTRGEIASLNIQKKQLKETGKLVEVSSIKKKQRSILINHQKEKNEMQRLKQMQKAASVERKTILKEQRNLIKRQLFMDNMLSKMKLHTPRERRLSGPLKVVQSHSESIRSESSIARMSSHDKDKDVFSVTSHTQSVVSRVSEISVEEMRSRDVQFNMEAMDLASRLTNEASSVPISQIKQSLLMREAALQKRRRAAEELLQWHKKLLEKERRITQLESAANAIISYKPNRISTSTDAEERHNFKGTQLNQLWFNLTGCEERKFAEDKTYLISQVALEQFCRSAREYTLKTKKKQSDGETRMRDSTYENVPNQNDMISAGPSGQSSNRNEITSAETLNDNFSDCNIELISAVFNEDVDVVDQNINHLIDDFSMIEEYIYSLSHEQSVKVRQEREQDNTPRYELDVQALADDANKTSHFNTSSMVAADQSAIERRTKDVFPKQASKITAKDVSSSDEKSIEDEHGIVSGGVIPQEPDIKSTEENSEKNLNSFEETEDLCIIEESISELQVEKCSNEEIIIINDEETPIEIIEIEDEAHEVIEIDDEETELTEEANEEMAPSVGICFESVVRSEESMACGKTPGEESVSGKKSPLLGDEVSKHNNEGSAAAVCGDIKDPELLPKDVNTDKVTVWDFLLLPQSSTRTDKSKGGVSEVKSSASETVDVSKIMTDANQVSKENNRPRLQDLCTLTYYKNSPTIFLELGFPVEKNTLIAKHIFNAEAEEIRRKQLAIEQEIKQITTQQRKEQQSYSLIRKIPNKPPPPYMSPLSPINVTTVVPTIEEIKEIAQYSAKLLYKAYRSHSLDNISISENTLGLISKTITKECYKFVFDLCKEISKEHYKQFKKEKCPSWLQVETTQLAVVKPFNIEGLERHLIKTLMELFGYLKIEHRKNAVISWSRKYRDHVDEVLAMESLTEEAQWTNCDKDQLLVMDKVTNDIMDDLLKETGQLFNEMLSKRSFLY